MLKEGVARLALGRLSFIVGFRISLCQQANLQETHDREHNGTERHHPPLSCVGLEQSVLQPADRRLISSLPPPFGITDGQTYDSKAGLLRMGE